MAEPAPLCEVHRAGRLVVRPAAVRARAGGGAGAVAIADEPAVAVPALPYRGIHPFRYADHTIFFARERETRLLTSLVDVYRGVFLYGDSGNGKSSLVSAGLLPEARRLGFEPVLVRVQPRTGEELVIEQLAISDDGSEILPCLLAAESDGSARVVLSVADFEARVRVGAEQHQPLIVFDQFEEILTLFDDEDAAASRRALAEMIVRLLREPLPVKLLFAFREDYLGRVKQLLAARPELVDQALRLGPPSADALDTIIRGPFERFPGRFERELDPALAQRLRAALAERFGSGEVSLTEVQTVCLRLWQSPDPQALLIAKGVQGLLEDELGETLDGFPPDLRAAAIALLSEMVTSAGTRNVISAEDLRQRVREDGEDIPPALLDDALDRLERESKLVRRERRRDLYLYEITSEFLVPWISRRRAELRLAQERRRGRRRLRIVASIGGGLLMLAVLVAVIVLGQRAEAQRQRAEAQRQAAEATSLALAASSVEPLATRPDVSLALAFEAYRNRARAETGSAVIRALLSARRSGLRGLLTGDAGISSIAFSPDGTILATAGAGGVRLWDAGTRTERGRPNGEATTASGLAFSPDGATLAAGTGARVSLWNPRTRKQIDVLTGHRGPVASVAFSPDGRILASAGTDGIRLWDPARRTQLRHLGDRRGAIRSVAFSPDGRTLASAGDGYAVRLWNVATSTARGGRLGGHSGPVQSVAFSPDGRTLAAADIDGTVRLWSPASRKVLGLLTGHDARATGVAFSPDGRLLAASGADSTVFLWDLATRKRVASLIGDEEWIAAIVFSPDGRTLASASDVKTIRLWNPATRTQPDRLAAAGGQVRDIAFSPDAKTLASAGFDGTIRLWDPATSTRRGSLRVHDDSAFDIDFSPDGKTLASASFDMTVGLSELATRRRLALLRGHGSTVYGVAFGPDGRLLASAGHDGAVGLWNPATRKRVARLTGHDAPVKAVTFSRDGRTLASAGDDATVRLWSPASRRQLARLTGHEVPVLAVAFSPDGRLLASAGEDTTVRLWNVATRRQVAVLTGHNGPVQSVAFSPDGGTLASAGGETTVRLWSVATGTELARLRGHDSPVSRVAFSPDGTLAAAAEDGAVRLWNDILWHGVRDLHATVCGVLLAGLSRQEWALYAPGMPYRRTCP